MKGTIVSNCERNFILRAAYELKRLDGRKLEGFRNLNVHFGKDWGLCYVSLGETKVLTQVTCEIQEPKTTRPNEGLLFVNVELSSMAAPHFESGRSSDLTVHINRLLEKCLKDSRAVDLESLCIVADEKVWVLRVDINVLNHDGSLVDCASISALAALAHFKRPDVTTDGQEIKVHSVSERDPIPITLHHYPICVSFAVLNDSEKIFADPTAIEERVSDASLTFGINAYSEICCLHLGGTALTKPKLILTCSTKAAARAKEAVNVIKESLKRDADSRLTEKWAGFVDSFEWDKITALKEGRLKIQLSKFSLNPQSNNQESIIKSEPDEFEIINLGDNCAELINSSQPHEDKMLLDDQPLISENNTNKEIISSFCEKNTESIGEGGPSKWEINFTTPNADSDSSESEVKVVSKVEVKPKQVDNIELSDDSEEEVVILNPESMDAQSSDLKQNQKNPKTNNIGKNKKKKNKSGKGRYYRKGTT